MNGKGQRLRIRFWLGQVTDRQTGQKFNRERDLRNETSTVYLARGPCWVGRLPTSTKQGRAQLSADIPGWMRGPGPRQRTHVRPRRK